MNSHLPLLVTIQGDEDDIMDFLEQCHPDTEAALDAFEAAEPIDRDAGISRLTLNWKEVPGR